MRNDTRNSAKKPDSSASASGSGLGSRDAPGLRRSTRTQPRPQISSSPDSIRKSQRLQKRGVETRATPSPLKRSTGKKAVSKNTGSKKLGPQGSKKERGLKEIDEDVVEIQVVEEDMTLKDIVKVARDSSPKIGEKRKKRLTATQLKAIFDSKNDETKSKKRKLESSFDNADSRVGDPSEGVSVNGDVGVDSDHLKSAEGIQVKCEEDEGCYSGFNPEKGLLENFNEDVVDRGIEEAGREPHECNDGEETEKGCAIENDGSTENPHLDSKKSLVIENSCETDDGEAQLASKGPNIPSQSATGIQDEKNMVNGLVGKVDGSKVEKLPNQGVKSALCREAENVDGSRCSETEIEVGAVVDGGEDTCKMGSLKEGCAKCSKKTWLDHDSLKQDPCSCVSYPMGGVNLISVSKDRGECSNARDEDGEKTIKSDFLHEAPELFSTLGEQDTPCNPEWAVPHRLLSRRSIIAENQDSGMASKSHHEWLVKWRCLDYDKATWELENSEFLKKPEIQQLIQEFETRHNGAKSSLMLGDNKAQERRNISHVKLGRVLDSYRAESVNKLREFYQKSHNAVLIEEQDRTTKVIYFISSIMSSVRRPFLIITPHESLSYWEAEFLRFTTSINVVVYSGNADSREIIRNLEFYGEDSKLMFQVLLSSGEAISEDYEHIQGIEWEVIIIDDCQKPSILRDSGCIKTLATNWKLLLLNGQLKDTTGEYIRILSLLETVGSSNDCRELVDASNEDINVLKEKLSSFIIYPRFQEYWVPVDISNVQLEQYCSVMLSNSGFLRQCSKSDPLDSLHDILISMQKCCDHPYIVNPLLRRSLLPEHPSQDAALDMGVKASGKLLLLDKLLSKFRNLRLKVVILFQSIGGSGKDNLEFLLDDLLTWRFGKDSFEHVAVGGQPSKKHAALNKFNKESDMSFLLLETRACLPSIKLSLVDSVIILNSDWNPLNELRALQKIMIDSKLKPIKVFRFYCSCTVEEKALILAKNDTILDNTVPINPSTKQTLLMWGSTYLFSRLNEFHHDKVLNLRDNVALGSSFVEDVFQEIVSLVKNDGSVKPNMYVSEALLDGKCYLKSTLLVGEQRNQPEKEVSSHTFWMKLLEGKQPQWKYLSVSSERNRKRVDYSDKLSLSTDFESDEPVKKRRDSSSLRQAERYLEKEDQGHPDTDIGLSAQDVRNGLHDQRGLFEMLKPTVLRLCETLMLKDGVKRLAERFLEYVLNNHRVTREPETILQAFQISVCWTAAEVLEKHIDHRKSLDIAIEKMNFKCLKQEADSVYGKMKLLMKIFLSRNLKILKPSIGPASAIDDGTRVLNKSCGNISSSNPENITVGCFNKEVCSPSQMTSNEKDCHGDVDKVRKFQERQKFALLNFEKFWQEKRAELEDSYKVESAVIRYSHAKSSDVVEKLKILENDYAKKRENLENQISNYRARHQEEKDGEQEKLAQLSELLKPVVHDGQLENVASGIRKQLQVDLPEEQNSAGKASVTDVPTLLPCNIENSLNGDVNSNLAEKNRAENENVISAHSVENASTVQGVAASNFVGEETCNIGFSAALADGTAHQDHGNEPCQQRVEEVEEQVRRLTESCSDRTNSTPSIAPHDGRTNASPATDQRFAISSQLNIQLNDAQTAFKNLCAQTLQQTPQLGFVPTVDANIDHGVSYVTAVRGASTADASHSNPTSNISQVSPFYLSDHLQSEYDRIREQIGGIINAHEDTVDVNIDQGVSYVTAVRGASTARNSHSNPTPTISQVPPFNRSDPLQNEYDRLRKQIDGIINAHEDKKLRLNSERDKEIEECVAEIRRRYYAKLEEAESSFSVKKNELELNQNLVMMNKFLADAFRSKCMDYKAESQGLQEVSHKGTSSSSKELPFQVQPTTKSSSATASCSVGPSATASNSTPPLTRGVNLSQTLYSSVPPTRPPHMRSSYGESIQGRHEIRAPSPRHQHPSFPSAMPSNNNLTSSSLRQTLARPSHQQLPSQPPVFHSSHDQFRLPSSTLSATELLMAMSRQNEANIRQLADKLPPLPENNMQNQESWDLSQFGKAVDVQQLAEDVVCLSDDD